MAVTPLSANAPQTTPSTVDDQIQPNATDQSTPMAPPLAQPTSAPTGVPSTASQVPVQPTAPKAPVATQTAPPRKALFDRILQSMTGGPSYVTDPHTGTTSEVPMTRATLSRHILAGALTGIIAGAQAGATAPAGPAGTMGPANAAALGAGFGATNAKMQEMRNAPQAAIDADTLRKQRAMQNNLFELQNQVALSKLNEEKWEQTEDHYNKSKDIFQPVLQDWERSDNDRVAGEPSLFVEGARGIGHEQAMKMMEGHQGEYMAIQDGNTTQDINGRTAHVPTYSLVRNSGTVNVSRKSMEALAPYNKDIATLLAKSSTENLPLPATQLMHIEKDAHQGLIAEQFVNDIRAAYDESHEGEKDYKPLGKVKDFSTMYRDNPALHTQVDQMMSELGSYGTHSPVSALDDIMSGGKGSAIVSALGIDRNKLSDFVQQRKADIAEQASLAKGAAQIKIQELKTANRPLTPNIAATIMADPNAAPTDKARAGAFQQVLQKQKEQQETTARAIKTGSVEEAGRMLYDGTLTLSQLKARSTDNKFIIDVTNRAQQLATGSGENDWTPQVREAQFKTAQGPQNVAFFGSANSLLTPKTGTLDLLQDAYNDLGNGQLPIFNKWEDVLAYQAGLEKSGSAMARFGQLAVGAADDYAKVMGGGVGTDQSRLQVLNSLTNKHNPKEMAGAIAGAKQAVSSQTSERIGTNPVLQNLYGYNVPDNAKRIKALRPQAQNAPAAAHPPAGAVGTQQFDDGKGNVAEYYVDASGKPLGRK